MTVHLDDEQLSAYLDGEEPGAAEHLDGCAACDSRLAALRGAASAVAGPAPRPPVGAEERAVAAALAGTTAARRERRAVTRLPRRPPAQWLAAAAAVAAIVVGLGAVRLLRGSPGTNQAQRATRAAPEAAAGTVVDGGDLGDMSDARALAGRLKTELAGSPVAARATSGKASPAQPGRAADRTAPGAAAAARPPCAAEAQKAYAPSGVLVYTAALRWEGEPAVALVYGSPGEGGRPARSQVLVMARAGCRLLVAQLI